MKNALPSEQVAVLGTIDPSSQSAGALVSDYVHMKYWHRLMAVLSVGALGASATVDAKLRQATDSSGTGVKDITGKSITQLTKAGSDDNKQVVLNLKAEELDAENGFEYVALSVTVATAACLTSAVLLGFDGRYEPASDNDLASVDEIIS